MKKTILIALMMVFMLGTTVAFASASDLKSNEPVATENKLSAEEVNRLLNRVEEIRKMDKSNMTSLEKRELRKEIKDIKKNVRKHGEIIYISGGAVLLVILILILI
jgi:uncharacterized membrane protein YvbJ